MGTNTPHRKHIPRDRIFAIPLNMLLFFTKRRYTKENAGICDLCKTTESGRASGHVYHGRGLMGNRYGWSHPYVWKNISRFRKFRILCTEHSGNDGSGTFTFLSDLRILLQTDFEFLHYRAKKLRMRSQQQK